MSKNPIRDLYLARAEQLLRQYEGSKTIAHDPTVGAMREEYLKSILREMLPQKFSPTSGFLADMHGSLSPQLDMIFFERSELPTVSLHGDTVIVPVEKALMIAEVKSTVTTKSLEQIERQRSAIEHPVTGLRPSTLSKKPPPRRLIPSVVFGFDSELSEERLEQWCTNHARQGIAGVCILNKMAIFPTLLGGMRVNPRTGLGEAVLKCPDYPSSELLLAFIGGIYRLLVAISIYNSPDFNDLTPEMIANRMGAPWEAYLSEFHFQLLQPPGPEK